MEAGERRAGFVLAGGRSSRMGTDKALLPWADATLVAHVARTVEAAAGSVTLVGHSERYGSLPYPLVADRFPNLGPVGGVEAALAASNAEWNLIVACDMPNLTSGFLTDLLEAAEASGRMCLVPVSPGGRLEPLCAVWHRGCLEGIQCAIRERMLRMTDIVAALKAVGWPVAEARWFDNLNTPGDWARHRIAGTR